MIDYSDIIVKQCDIECLMKYNCLYSVHSQLFENVVISDLYNKKKVRFKKKYINNGFTNDSYNNILLSICVTYKHTIRFFDPTIVKSALSRCFAIFLCLKYKKLHIAKLARYHIPRTKSKLVFSTNSVTLIFIHLIQIQKPIFIIFTPP